MRGNLGCPFVTTGASGLCRSGCRISYMEPFGARAVVAKCRNVPLQRRAVVVSSRFLALALALSVASVSVAAQSGASKGRKRSRPAATAKPAFVFSRDVDSLPSNYLGEDPADIVVPWINGHRPKGEFESTADYRAAIEKRVPSKALAFRLPIGAGSTGAVRYDADVEQVVVTVATAKELDGTFRVLDAKQSETYASFEGKGIVVWWKRTDRKTFTGRNVFGRRVRAWRDTYVNFGIAFANGGRTFPAREVTVKLEMDRATAKRTKPDLRVLLVCHVDRSQLPDRIAFVDVTNSEATASVPIDEWFYWYWLAVVLDEIWIYNLKTGEILLQAPVSAGSSIAAAPASADGELVRRPLTEPERNQALARARDLVVAGKDAEALLEIASVIGKNPDLAPAYTLRALVLERLNRLSEAAEASQTAIALDPSVITPYLVDARLAIKQKDCVAAKRSIDAAAAIEVTSPELAPLRELYETACQRGGVPD